MTNPDFKFPQFWRTNIGLDQRLPWGVTGTLEFIYSRDVNGIYYINANLPAAQTAFVGRRQPPAVYQQPHQSGSRRPPIVLKNQDDRRVVELRGVGREDAQSRARLKTAYSYGRRRTRSIPGSIAAGSWQNNPHSADPNNPGTRHLRAVARTPLLHRRCLHEGLLRLGRHDDFRVLGEPDDRQRQLRVRRRHERRPGTNDLIYVPRDQSEMNFVVRSLRVAGRSPGRAGSRLGCLHQPGQVPEHTSRPVRRARSVMAPDGPSARLQHRAERVREPLRETNAFQFRVDIDNFTNLLNSDWGVGQRTVAHLGKDLTNPITDTQGRSTYRLRTT